MDTNNQIKVSLIASSVRPQLYESFFESLKGTSVPYEVVFAGNCLSRLLFPYSNMKYIETGNIKPAQCYEIARRNAIGETIVWVADDCEFPNDVIGKAYKHWRSSNCEKLVLSIQTRETGYRNEIGSLFNMKAHRFFGYKNDTPLMAPLGMMSREYLEYLGGFDQRYVCGQYENDVVMRVLKDGGRVEIFGDKECFIDIDHLGKSIMIGESKNDSDFRDRPFATGYAHDRRVLESSWCPLRRDYRRQDKFQPYEDKDILIESQSFKGKWE